MIQQLFKPFYKRKLPHYSKNHVEYFITSRLEGTLPMNVVQELQEEEALEKWKIDNNLDLSETEKREQKDKIYRKYFGKYDTLLDDETGGPTWLKQPEVAKIVSDSFFHFDSIDKKYELICFCIMSNHFHLVFRIIKEDYPISKIMQSIKGFTSRMINKQLGKTGDTWQDESYDRIVRDGGELFRIIQYVLNNPVKIGLVKKWEDWEFSYLNPDYAF
jgi:putative transposase